MATRTRNALIAAFIGLLVACGGGGGGDRAAGVDPGPAAPGAAAPPPAPIVPTPNPSPYADAEELLVDISSVTLDANNQPIVEWQLTDSSGTAIIDLAADDVRFTIAKLQDSPLGNMTGSWLSYINRIEQPGVGPGTEARLQATAERAAGEFTNNQDGTYRYHFALSLSNLSSEVLDQAASEGLDLSFDADLTHRIAMQFDGAPGKANPIYDWIPATGATSGIFAMDIAATASCNGCHDPLALHGGGRREIQYCVTCHNPGSGDANSGNTVDFKVMVHKLHRGKHLPSVEAGGEYAIWGFRDSKHDYSHLGYPQDIRNCVNCHAGSETGTGLGELPVVTSSGDNWANYPSQSACGSCHDDLEFSTHEGGQEDDSGCASCHSIGGDAGSIQSSHAILLAQARKAFKAEVTGVSNSMPGETPVVSFRVSNPTKNDEDYDLKNDPAFDTESGASLNVKMSWDADNYHNTGNGLDNASSVSIDALGNAVDNGDGSYSVTMPQAIPDGSAAPGIAASGTGVATIEGHPVVDYDGDGEVDQVPVGDVHRFFSIDEADGEPDERRDSVEIAKCLSCHSSLVLHGNNRADNINSCVTCHNPRNTDRGVRATAGDPPTDGKQEESIHFTTMIHGIHAAGMRENALEVVGFRGFSTHRYNEEEVHYPGNLANCTGCHTSDGFTLPLADGALGTSVDTGEDLRDPGDDTVITAASAACSSCHDDSVAKSHMTLQGGSFDTTQAAIDSGEVVESCEVCHGTGRSEDAAVSHRKLVD